MVETDDTLRTRGIARFLRRFREMKTNSVDAFNHPSPKPFVANQLALDHHVMSLGVWLASSTNFAFDQDHPPANPLMRESFNDARGSFAEMFVTDVLSKMLEGDPFYYVTGVHIDDDNNFETHNNPDVLINSPLGPVLGIDVKYGKWIRRDSYYESRPRVLENDVAYRTDNKFQTPV